ncbi:Solute carrier family 25 member 44 [Halotydeus destructor]|nr:Solute carrier family 25 member 44 [Halotydeus destructor]
MDPVEPPGMLTIEWEMMDKNRFLSFSVLNSVALRTVIYPLTVIKTRLQVQKQHNPVYKGTADAFVKILKYEGISGLYRGFVVNTMQVISGIGYIVTYETMRHAASKYGDIHDNRIRGLIGGGCGSLVSQTIITPFDVISQHMMVIHSKKQSKTPQKFSSFTNPLIINKNEVSKFGLSVAIMKELYRRDKFKGFYRGYLAALLTYVPSSGLWWMFYPIYSEFLVGMLPVWTSHMLIQCVAGSVSGASAAALTNPLDVLRANIQVQRMESYKVAIDKMWAEEGYRVLYKGLSARLTHSFISSAFIAAGYETLKRWSVYDEYRDKIRW